MLPPPSAVQLARLSPALQQDRVTARAWDCWLAVACRPSRLAITNTSGGRRMPVEPSRRHAALKRHRWTAVLVAGLSLLAQASAPAQGLGATDYPFYAAPQLSFAASNFMNLSVLNQAQADPPPAARGVSTVAPRPPVSLHTAEMLARAYSPRQPGPLASVFGQSLDLFAQVAQKAQQPADDVAVALAFFVAANYAASKGEALVADADFPRLAAQMRSSLSGSGAFQQADARTKRETFEQLAMVGMFVYLAKLEFDKNPASEPAQQFRQHARANLASVLGTTADRVVLVHGQLVLR
jgi:hypothetical protein